jgi:hypothetical protein
VTLLAQWKSLRILPQLIYVPFGASQQGTDIPLHRALAPTGIDLRIGHCERIDLESHTVHTDFGELGYDALVVASGTLPEPTNAHRLRTLNDALRLRSALDDLEHSPSNHRSIALRVPASCTWSPPAFEFALLLAAWRDERKLDDIRISLELEESAPLQVFDPHSGPLLAERLRHNNIEMLTHIPNHRLDLMDASIAIDFGQLKAQRIVGMPPLNADGFYTVDNHGSAGKDLFVVGDAANTYFKGAFATGWHARRVARALGGDLSVLGDSIEGIPTDECEYQMDLGHDVLATRLAAPSDGMLTGGPRVMHSEIRNGAAEKLIGTLTHELLRREMSRMQISLAVPHSA